MIWAVLPRLHQGRTNEGRKKCGTKEVRYAGQMCLRISRQVGAVDDAALAEIYAKRPSNAVVQFAAAVIQGALRVPRMGPDGRQ